MSTESRTYYYARVSSKEQNLDIQLAAFASLGASEREIIRLCSATSARQTAEA